MAAIPGFQAADITAHLVVAVFFRYFDDGVGQLTGKRKIPSSNHRRNCHSARSCRCACWPLPTVMVPEPSHRRTCLAAGRNRTARGGGAAGCHGAASGCNCAASGGDRAVPCGTAAARRHRADAAAFPPSVTVWEPLLCAPDAGAGAAVSAAVTPVVHFPPPGGFAGC